MLSLHDDCINLIFNEIDSGRFYKVMTLVCQRIYQLLHKRDIEFVDKYCFHAAQAWRTTNGLFTEDIAGKLPKGALTIGELNMLAINHRYELAHYPYLPLKILSDVSSWDTRVLSKVNVYLTPKFIAKHVNIWEFCGMHRFEWCTMEFMKSIGASEQSLMYAHDYPLEYFMRDWFFGHKYSLVHPVTAFNIVRDIGYLREIEESVYFPLSMVGRIFESGVYLTKLHRHPLLTWRVVQDNPNFPWDYYSLLTRIKDPMPDETMQRYRPIDLLRREVIHPTEWRHIDIDNSSWPILSYRAHISIILQHSHHPWNWRTVSLRVIRYSDIKDHLHLPWHWPTLSESIIISAKEYFSDATIRSLITDEYLLNKNANHAIRSSMVAMCVANKL